MLLTLKAKLYAVASVLFLILRLVVAVLFTYLLIISEIARACRNFGAWCRDTYSGDFIDTQF